VLYAAAPVTGTCQGNPSHPNSQQHPLPSSISPNHASFQIPAGHVMGRSLVLPLRFHVRPALQITSTSFKQQYTPTRDGLRYASRRGCTVRFLTSASVHSNLVLCIVLQHTQTLTYTHARTHTLTYSHTDALTHTHLSICAFIMCTFQ